MKLSKKIEEVFGADVRSLAAFRVGLALLILVDLAKRFGDLKAHYTDLGLLPRAPFIEQFLNPLLFSIHLMSGLAWVQAVLFLLAAVFAVGLLIGYRTRWCTFFCWFMTCSLQARNPYILEGGDDVLRLLLFWSLFLPLGAWGSMDARGKEESGKRFVSFGTAGIFIQIALIYFFAGIHKTGAEWRDGSAVYQALSIDLYAGPLGVWLRDHHYGLTQFLTWSVYLYECFGPFLLFSPWFSGPVRTVAVFLFGMMQLGMGSCLQLEIFPWVNNVALISMLPSWFWDRLWNPVILRKKPAAETESVPAAGSSPWANLLAAFFLFFIVFWNIGNLQGSTLGVPARLKGMSWTLGLYQNWHLFAPYPMKEDGWFVIPGKLRDGTEVDVFRKGAPITWEKPLYVSQTFKTNRWRKWMMTLALQPYAGLRLYYGRYLCREWNSSHPEPKQLETFEIVYMLERSLPYGQSPRAQKISIWKHHCF